MSPFFFDIIVIVLVLLSAGLGFLRGFCNEIFTIFGWIGAVLATILLTPLSREFMRGHIHNKIIADLTTASIIFIVTMVVFSIISHYATKTLQGSKLNAVDRSLGFGFGILRGVLLIGLMFLLMAWVYTPDNRPTFVKEAKTRPILEASAHIVQFILPGDATIDVDAKDAEESKLDSVMKGKTDDTAKPAVVPDDAAAQKSDDASLDEFVTEFQKQTKSDDSPAPSPAPSSSEKADTK